MKFRKYYFLFIILLIIILIIFASLKFKNKANPLSNWTLEEKVGQLMIVNFSGQEQDYYINKMINERNLGGVILMGDNIKDQEQVKNLTSALQGNSKQTKKHIPLFIAIDQEGGEVVRLKDINKTAQKDLKNTEQAVSAAKTRGEQLKKLNININLAPVLDYSDDPKSFIYSRTFQQDLNKSANLAQAMAQGYNQANIIYVPKHFPGHGNSKIDSHESQPIILDSKKDLLKYAKPFQQVIATQNPKIIMASHALYPKIDPDNPASLSKKIINILKQDLNYQGLIITDDLSMKSITSRFSLEQAAIKALQAGNDLILIIASPEEQVQVYDAIISAVKSKKISIQDIDQKVLKILELKKSNFIKSNQ